MATSKTRLALCSTLLLAACDGDATFGDDVSDDAGWHACCDARPGDVDGGAGDPDATIPPPDASDVTASVCAAGADFTTIAAAIASLPDGGSVFVCAGTYPERLSITDRSIELHGAGAGTTILDAGGAGTAVDISGSHALTIDGFTIKGGSTRGVRCADSTLRIDASAFVDNSGGGIYATGCVLDVTGTSFSNNTSVDFGGAGYLVSSAGTIDGATFTGNTAHDGGGALFLDEGSVDISNSTFTSNTGFRGGAVNLRSDSTFTDSTFTLNSSGWTGGAVYVWQHAPEFHRVTLSNNQSGWEGGSMYFHMSQAVIEDSTISYNTSFDDGGGIRIFESRMRLERNIFDHNKATDGDGGAFKSSHLPSIFIDNQLLANEALGAGGGAEFDNDSSQWHGGVMADNRASIGGGFHAMRWPWNDGIVEGVDIRSNHAWRGGGVYLENHFHTITLRGLHIHGNHANQAAGIYFRGTPLVFTNSVIEGNLADDLGGGIEYAPDSDYPWTDPCPCPPTDPPASVSFVVVNGNTADSGAGAWIKAPDLTIHDSIFAGHTTTAIQVDNGLAVTWRYNDVYPATFTGMDDPTGASGNMASAPDFVGASDFHLGVSSSLLDKGDPALHDLDGSRADLGAYAGPTPMP